MRHDHDPVGALRPAGGPGAVGVPGGLADPRLPAYVREAWRASVGAMLMTYFWAAVIVVVPFAFGLVLGALFGWLVTG